jgi:hypothetical protein
MTEAHGAPAYGWDIDPEVLTLLADIQEMRTELDTALARERELRDQVARLVAVLERAGLPLPDPGRSPLSLAA